MNMKYLPLFLLLFLAACGDGDNVSPTDPDEYKAGGSTTVYGVYSQVFQQPSANLDAQGIADHLLGDANFEAAFVTAPATIQGGLGPLFNQNSCAACHVRNGRAAFPESPDDPGGLLIRLSIPGENDKGEPLDVPGYGGQLQTKAVWGKVAEAQLDLNFTESLVQYLDKSEIRLRKPVFTLKNPYANLDPFTMTSARIAPPVIGLGLLEAIPEADLMAIADENDLDGDGISGRPNLVWDYTANRQAVGRFGWKAGQPSVLQQTAGAYNGDMGITNPIFSAENCLGQLQCDNLSDDPEIDWTTLKSAAFYTQSLAVPAPRQLEDAQVQQGRTLFREIQCAKCHVPSFTTGQHPEFDFLSNQKIFPYTDLLLHDMGEGLADNRPDHRASGQEWRTPPLWGIGLTYTVNGHTNFLHDGRARNLEEAILWHGGEAEQSKEAFRKLPASERAALVAFLNAL